MKKIKKDEIGITIIALVITIIVLLILAGVTISGLNGENGIITKSKEAKIKAIHAGLECGLFLEKYPQLDMISFGPTLRDVHSPNERIEIATVQLWWDHLLEVLKSVPAK